MASEELKLPQFSEAFHAFHSNASSDNCTSYTEDNGGCSFKAESLVNKLNELMYKKENEQFYSELLKPRCSAENEERNFKNFRSENYLPIDLGITASNSFDLNSLCCSSANNVAFNPFGLTSLFPCESMFPLPNSVGSYDMTYDCNYPMYSTQDIVNSSHEDISRIIQNTTNINKKLQEFQPIYRTESKGITPVDVSSFPENINLNAVGTLSIITEATIQEQLNSKKRKRSKKHTKGEKKPRIRKCNQKARGKPSKIAFHDEIKLEENKEHENKNSTQQESIDSTNIENIENGTNDHQEITHTNIESINSGTIDHQEVTRTVNTTFVEHTDVETTNNLQQNDDTNNYDQAACVSNLINMINPTDDIESNMFIKTSNSTARLEELSDRTYWTESSETTSDNVYNVINMIDPRNNIEYNMFNQTDSVVKIKEKNAIAHEDELLEHVLPDAFTLWQRKFRKLVKEEYPDATEKVIAEKLKEVWGKLPDQHRVKYYSMADDMVQKYKKSLTGNFSNKNIENKVDCVKPVIKPTPIRITTENGQQEKVTSNEGHVNDIIPNMVDDYSSTGIDFSKAMKESMTYYSADKYAKRRMGKRKAAEVNTEFIDENEIATGYLEDIMMVNTGTFNDEKLNIEYDYGAEYERLLLNEGPFDISELDSYLAGEDTYQLGSQVEIETQHEEDEEELQGREERKKTKKVMQKKRRLQSNRQRLLDVKEKLAEQNSTATDKVNEDAIKLNDKHTEDIAVEKENRHQADSPADKNTTINSDEIYDEEIHEVVLNDEKKSHYEKRCTRMNSKLISKCKANITETVDDDKPSDIKSEHMNNEKLDEAQCKPIIETKKSSNVKRKPCRKKLT